MNLIKQEIVEREGIKFLEEVYRDDDGKSYYLSQRLTLYSNEELEQNREGINIGNIQGLTPEEVAEKVKKAIDKYELENKNE